MSTNSKYKEIYEILTYEIKAFHLSLSVWKEYNHTTEYRLNWNEQVLEKVVTFIEIVQNCSVLNKFDE